MNPFKTWVKDRWAKAQKYNFSEPSRSQAEDKFSATKNSQHVDIMMVTAIVVFRVR